MFKLVKENEAVARRAGADYLIKDYLTKDFNRAVSLVTVTLDGEHTVAGNEPSDRIYFFTDGNATFNINGVTIHATKNDTLFIEKNTPYHVHGTFTAVLINTPAFGV